MPSVSKRQHNLMAMVANDPAAAKRVGIPQSVGEDFMQADKGKKFGSGGTGSRADLQGINNPKVHRGKMALFAKGGDMASKKLFGGKESYTEELKEAKAIKSGKITPQQYARGERKEEQTMKMKKMARGGAVDNIVPVPVKARGGAVDNIVPVPVRAKGGITTAKMGSVKTASPSRDGMATKGKTKGTQVKMAASKPLGMKRGGKC